MAVQKVTLCESSSLVCCNLVDFFLQLFLEIFSENSNSYLRYITYLISHLVKYTFDEIFVNFSLKIVFGWINLIEPNKYYRNLIFKINLNFGTVLIFVL